MQYKLNIYDETHKKVERTATAEEFDLFYGTVESVSELIDIDKVKNNFDVIKIVVKCKNEIVSLLKDVFPDVTPDEWKRIKVKDIASVLLQIVKTTITGINLLSDEKN